MLHEIKDGLRWGPKEAWAPPTPKKKIFSRYIFKKIKKLGPPLLCSSCPLPKIMNHPSRPAQEAGAHVNLKKKKNVKKKSKPSSPKPKRKTKKKRKRK